MSYKKLTDRRDFIKASAGTTIGIAICGHSIFSDAKAVVNTRGDYKVFSRGSIGNMQLKNRMVKAASSFAPTTGDCSFLTEGNEIYRNLSMGGVGLIITGHMTVDEIPEGSYSHLPTCIHSDNNIPALKTLARAVHDADSDCKIVAQINHIGMKSLTKPVSASPVTWQNIKRKPKTLTTAEVEIIVEQFISAAKRAKVAGFDAVEIHGAHGYLLNTFLSPYTNQRTDRFGGSWENRARVVKDIVDGIKKFDPQFPILLKISATDAVEAGGVNINNISELVGALVKTGIDAVELSGNDTTRMDLDEPEEQSYYSAYAEKISTDIPVILTEGNKNVELIEKLAQKGDIDYFAFARPLIREPNLPNRWLAGKGDAECDCISCNQCKDYLFTGQNIVTCQQLNS